MTKTINITINGSTKEAVDATAAQYLAQTQKLANWVNANQKGAVTSVSAQTQDVTVVRSRVGFTADKDGTLNKTVDE